MNYGYGGRRGLSFSYREGVLVVGSVWSLMRYNEIYSEGRGIIELKFGCFGFR